jgi:hypothetical protein
MAQGWENESERHSLASHGVKSFRGFLRKAKNVAHAPRYAEKSAEFALGMTRAQELRNLAREHKISPQGAEELMGVFEKYGAYHTYDSNGQEYVEFGENGEKVFYYHDIPMEMRLEVRAIVANHAL